jgi:hypothetical protein
MRTENPKIDVPLYSVRQEGAEAPPLPQQFSLPLYEVRRNISELHEMWRRAAPALMKIADIRYNDWMAMLFLVLSDEPKDRKQALHCLNRSLEELWALAEPRHDEGVKRVADKPSVVIPDFLRLLGELEKADGERTPPTTPTHSTTAEEPKRRRRHLRGSRKPPGRGSFVYTEKEVERLRRVLAKEIKTHGRANYARVARELGMSKSYVRSIARGELRQPIPEEAPPA